MFTLNPSAAIRRQLAETTSSPFRRVLSAPLFTVGYILLLIGLARAIATSLGWSANLFLVGLGALHIALAILVGAAARPEPGVAEPPFFVGIGETPEMALERADTLVMDRVPSRETEAALSPPAFPPRTRTSS